MNELKTRRVADILIAVVDGLSGFPEAIGVVFPKTTVDTRIVHLGQVRELLGNSVWCASAESSDARPTVSRTPDRVPV